MTLRERRANFLWGSRPASSEVLAETPITALGSDPLSAQARPQAECRDT